MQAMNMEDKDKQFSGFAYSHPWISDRVERDPSRFKQPEVKSDQRDEIDRQVQEYLAKGGKIQQCGSDDNREAKRPIKPTRKESFDEFKKFTIRKS